ncbi:hypothetical protein Tco_0280806 [Tanacetum coccineum]
MPSFPSPEPTVSYFNDLDFFIDFENKFPAIVYNAALTSKLDFLIEPAASPQHIDEFDLNDETSLSECDEEKQNVLYFDDLFPFNVIYPDDSKSDKDNDDDKIDIKQSSGGNVINTDNGDYAQRSNKLLETSHDTSIIMEYLVNISKRRANQELKEEYFRKISILTINTLYPSRKIRRIRACTNQRPQRKHDQYAVSREDQYAVLEI